MPSIIEQQQKICILRIFNFTLGSTSKIDYTKWNCDYHSRWWSSEIKSINVHKMPLELQIPWRHCTSRSYTLNTRTNVQQWHVPLLHIPYRCLPCRDCMLPLSLPRSKGCLVLTHSLVPVPFSNPSNLLQTIQDKTRLMLQKIQKIELQLQCLQITIAVKHRCTFEAFTWQRLSWTRSPFKRILSSNIFNSMKKWKGKLRVDLEKWKSAEVLLSLAWRIFSVYTLWSCHALMTASHIANVLSMFFELDEFNAGIKLTRVIPMFSHQCSRGSEIWKWNLAQFLKWHLRMHGHCLIYPIGISNLQSFHS